MKKILIIEDEKEIANLEKDYLELSGFTVDIEHNGIKGLIKAKSNNYCLIILDLMIPEVDGFTICKELREFTNIPIVIVSARKDDIDKIRGLGIGADDYVTKPFSPSELVARVKAHIMRYDRLIGTSDGRAEEIVIKELKIDKVSRKVYISDKEVILTTKEFELLVFLAENPNRVFSKEELFNKIWGLNSIGDITTVTVHIRKIREKIEKDPSEPSYVETIWGAGYRFND